MPKPAGQHGQGGGDQQREAPSGNLHADAPAGSEAVRRWPYRGAVEGETGRAGLSVLSVMKPKPVDPEAGIWAFQATLTAVAAAPDWVTVAFQDWVIRWPPGRDQVSVQPLTGRGRGVADA